MLKYEWNIGMNYCLFHDEEKCHECTAVRCIYWDLEWEEIESVLKELIKNNITE